MCGSASTRITSAGCWPAPDSRSCGWCRCGRTRAQRARGCSSRQDAKCDGGAPGAARPSFREDRGESMTTVTEKMHPFAAATSVGREPFKVKDLALAEFGRKEI